jgi:hypothetical protein
MSLTKDRKHPIENINIPAGFFGASPINPGICLNLNIQNLV